MAKYVKLGSKARSFSDPYTEFSIFGSFIKELTREQQLSPRIKRALSQGHLVEATEEEFKKKNNPDAVEVTKTDGFDDMSKAELLDFYLETYEVDADEQASFEKLNKEGRITFLRDLAKEV